MRRQHLRCACPGRERSVRETPRASLSTQTVTRSRRVSFPGFAQLRQGRRGARGSLHGCEGRCHRQSSAAGSCAARV